MVIAAVVLGIIVGVLLEVVGGGGSILAVPALVYGVGLPLDQAIPTWLIVVGTASAVAVLPRLRGGVKWRLALIVGSSGVVTAFASSAVNELLDTQFLLLIFAAIMVVAGIRMLLRQRVGGGPCSRSDGGAVWRSCLPRAIGMGAVVGFLTGLLVVGGGFLIVPFAFAGGAMLASLVSSRAGKSLPDMAIKRAFAVFVLIVAVFVAVSAFVI